jgi:hypothetical protein
MKPPHSSATYNSVEAAIWLGAGAALIVGILGPHGNQLTSALVFATCAASFLAFTVGAMTFMTASDSKERMASAMRLLVVALIGLAVAGVVGFVFGS